MAKRKSNKSEFFNLNFSTVDDNHITEDMPRASQLTRLREEEENRLIKQELTDQSNQIKKQGKKIEDLGSQLDKQRSKNLEVLTIFVSLFTFISIQVQLLANTNKEISVPLSLLLLGGLLLFSSLLVVITTMFNTAKFWIALVVAILSAIALYLSWQTYQTYESKQDICSHIKLLLEDPQSPAVKTNLEERKSIACNITNDTDPTNGNVVKQLQ